MRIDKYDISADTNQFILSEVRVVTDEKSKNFGETVLVNKTFHTSWEGLLIGLSKREMKESVKIFSDIKEVENAFKFSLMHLSGEIKEALAK